MSIPCSLQETSLTGRPLSKWSVRVWPGSAASRRSSTTKVLNKPLDSTFVIIEEIDIDNWGIGGLPVAGFRRQRTKTG